MSDKRRGLYEKFEVRRTDGRDRPGEKHHGCRYFVLDLDHDPLAYPALVAYADVAEKVGYRALARDLRKLTAGDGKPLRKIAPEPVPFGDEDVRY